MENKEERKPFKLTDEELANPKFRKGFKGYLHTSYPNTLTWKQDAIMPHPNYDPLLSSYYKAGRYVGIREELMSGLNATLPAPKVKREDK